MSIKSRVEKLEQASAPEDEGIRLLWRSIVRRDADDRLVERPHSAHIPAGPHGPAETLVRHETDRLEPFLRWVAENARRIHGRSGPEFEASLQWAPTPDTHQVE